MLQKVITGENSDTSTSSSPISLKMQYNKGNQLISMANGQDRIAYSYDKNGSMVKKVLTSKTYGKLSDTYEYNALDQLTSYIGYDRFQQQLTYDANGMRLSKKETGNTNRSTLEELLRGNIAGLPEIVEPNKNDTLPEELEWASTEYLYDLTQEYYQVIEEKKTNTSGTSRTAYAYGIERIAAYTDIQKTTYVYDGRGSVVQTHTIPVAGQGAMAALPDTQVKVQSFTYTAFGEQMGRKISGFGYNAEAFDASTGMINLRARQYEPVIGRFYQKDQQSGYIENSLSIQIYLYTMNNPINYVDADGMRPIPPDKTRQYFTLKQSSLTAQKTNDPKRKAEELAQLVVSAKSRADRERQANAFINFVTLNQKYLPAYILDAYNTAIDNVRNQEAERLQANKKKKPSSFRGKTRLPSDHIAEACSKILGTPFTPNYLNNLKSKGNWTFAKNSYAADNKKTNPDLNYTLDTVLQTYFEGWYYSNTSMQYGRIVCDNIDRLSVKAWRDSGKSLVGTSLPTTVYSSFQQLEKKGLIENINKLSPGELVYYAWNGKTDKNKKRESAKDISDIYYDPSTNEVFAAKHMGMVIGELLLYDLESQSFKLINVATIHSASEDGVVITDMANPGKYNRFFLHGTSNQIENIPPVP